MSASGTAAVSADVIGLANESIKLSRLPAGSRKYEATCGLATIKAAVPPTTMAVGLNSGQSRLEIARYLSDREGFAEGVFSKKYILPANYRRRNRRDGMASARGR